jgi:hypothetical protein
MNDPFEFPEQSKFSKKRSVHAFDDMIPRSSCGKFSYYMMT